MFGQLKISDDTFFFVGTYPTLSPYALHFFRYLFGNTSPVWSFKLDGASGYSAFYSESLLSTDKTRIYTFDIYGNPRYLYFITFDSSNGSVLGSRYKSSISCGRVNGGTIKDKFLMVTVECLDINLIIVNTETSEILIKKFDGTKLNACIVENTSGRVVVTGLKGGGYVTKFMIESISAHPNFSPSTTFTMNILSAGNEPVSIDASLSLTSTSYSIASVVYPNQTLVYNLVVSVPSDVYFQTEDQTFSITENNEVQLSPSLPCSHSGSTSITYSIGDYNGNVVPSWISIDPNTGLLTILSKNLSSDTQIDFQIISTSSGIDTQKVIRLSILDCVVSNCLKCNKLSNSICLLCNSGYVLSNNNCITNSSSTSANSTQINSIIEPSETSKSIKTTTQSILASTAGITAAFSVVNTSSLSTLFLIIFYNYSL